MEQLITTLGPRTADELGIILPHEHIFVDLGPIAQRCASEAASYKDAHADDVIRLMRPELEAIIAQGVTALVDCTPVGVGRRTDIVAAVSQAVGLPIVVPTGIYREPWIPGWAHDAALEELETWMLGELTEQIEQSQVQAAWIKLSAGDDGITACEEKILRAAARAGRRTNAAIGSHTIRARVVHRQLDIIQEEGYDPGRFIWIHTQAEPDFAEHLAVGRRGAWLEYDTIGNQEVGDQFFVDAVRRLLDAQLGDRLLLSHDRGWYDPSQPGGGVPKPYTYLLEHFLPKLRRAGLDQATLDRLTIHNPFRAFAR